MTKEQPKVSRLREKRDELNAKIQRELAREQRLDREREAKKDSIIGRLVRARVENGRWPRDRFDAMVQEDLTKAAERKLFDLPPLKDADSAEDVPAPAGVDAQTGLRKPSEP